MRLLLIRHAPTAETGSRLTGRLPGVGLSADGRHSAARLAERLEGLRLDALYTSPQQRCRETARAIGGPAGLTPVSYRSFAEVDYGTWMGRSLASLRRTKLWRQLFVAPSRVRFPGGESLAEVQARAVAAVEELAARHPRHTVAVVSHGDVIKAVLAHYLGIHLDLFQRLAVGPATVAALELPEVGAPFVLGLNAAEAPGAWT